MRSVAVFVDAGYLFSAGSCSSRRAADCCDDEPLRLLRTYWYDGAVDGIPSPEQVAVGELPRVKLRLGRVTGGGQKGVDGLIILDLINLARNRAVDIVLLLTGDEDIREAALFAQGFGVSLLVAGFVATKDQRPSELLLREADHVVYVMRDDIAPHLSLEPSAGAPSAAEPAPADPVETDDPLVELCRGVVAAAREEGHPVADETGERLTRETDRILITRLSELTGRFPVVPAVLQRARPVCIALATGN